MAPLLLEDIRELPFDFYVEGEIFGEKKIVDYFSLKKYNLLICYKGKSLFNDFFYLHCNNISSHENHEKYFFLGNLLIPQYKSNSCSLRLLKHLCVPN